MLIDNIYIFESYLNHKVIQNVKWTLRALRWGKNTRRINLILMSELSLCYKLMRYKKEQFYLVRKLCVYMCVCVCVCVCRVNIVLALGYSAMTGSGVFHSLNLQLARQKKYLV